MPELQLDPKSIKTVKDHQYYLFTAPATHTNQTDRPTDYADETILKTYAGRGTNGVARLHPDVLTAANTLMCALLDYGAEIVGGKIGTEPTQQTSRRQYKNRKRESDPESAPAQAIEAQRQST